MCVTPEPVREGIQTCEYYGSDITRYRVTRAFVVVEPSSGAEVASFSITAEPRTCRSVENAGVTEFEGVIDRSMVEARLVGLVENGVFVDPDAPDASGEPDGTLPPGEPTAAPDPSVAPNAVELRQALADGLVSVTGAGDGLAALDLELTSEVDQTLEVSIEAGTLLEPRARATQTMMVVWGTSVSLDARATESVSLDVACVQMHQDQPTGDDRFLVISDEPDPDMILLLNAPELADASGRVRQFAIWTITNNPRRNGYVGLTSGFSVFGSGPDDEELTEIKALFEAAGIDTGSYRALR